MATEEELMLSGKLVTFYNDGANLTQGDIRCALNILEINNREAETNNRL